MGAQLVRKGDRHAELPQCRVELEEVFSVADGPGRKVIRFVRDDARVSFEVPHRGAEKRRVLGCAQLLECGERFDRRGVSGTLATMPEDIVTVVCQ